jgi:cysteine desulfurase
VGDTILPGSIGRSNFPSSSSSALYDSLKAMYALLGDTCLLLSSHDYHNDFFTSFAVEIANNCLLRDTLKNELAQAEFVTRKTSLDATLNDVAGQTIMCGAYSGDQCDKAINEYTYKELDALLSSDQAITLLDIREPYEFELSHTQNPVLNVPLTQLADFVANKGLDKAHPFVLICRSGSRSLVAAKALERFGFNAISHIVGGYALS